MKSLFSNRNVLKLGFVALALTGCEEVTTPDGKIPASYLAAFKEFTGDYAGSLQIDSPYGPSTLGKSTLAFNIKADEPSLEFSRDLLGGRCESGPHELTSFVIDRSKTGVKLLRATFHFSPGYCPGMAEGRNLFIFLTKEKDGERSIHVRLTKVVGRSPRNFYIHDTEIVGNFTAHARGASFFAR